MSLFSGMKLANSNPERQNSDGPLEMTAAKMGNMPPTEIRKDPQCGSTRESPDSSRFSFILDTVNLKHRGTSQTEFNDEDDQQACEDCSSHSPESAIDDLNVDLDPIKVTGHAQPTGGERHPAGFDLQDVDFSVPSEHEYQEELEQPTCGVKSTSSSFCFITEDCATESAKDKLLASGNRPVDEEASRNPRGPWRAKLQIEEGVSQRVDRKNSSLDRRTIYREEYEKKLNIFRKSTRDVVGRAVQLAKDCVQSGFSLLEKQQQLQASQKQQQKAIDEEDFEKAEELHLQCQGLEEEIGQSGGSLLTRDHPALRNLFADIRTLHEQEKSERQSMTQKYRALVLEQEEAVAEARGRCAQWESDRLRKVQEDRNRLNTDLGHLHLDKDHLSKREASLTDQIAEGTAHLCQARDVLTDDSAKVQDEIRVLEAKLSALRLQENVISEAIVKKDREIAMVTSDFEDERSALEREKGVLEGAELELTRRGEELEEEERTLAEGREEARMAEERESKLLSDLQEDLVKEEGAIDNLKGKDEFALTEAWLEDKTGNLSKSRAALLKNKQAVKLRMEDVQKATSVLLQSQNRVVTLRKQVSDTEGHIASLSDSRRLAVSGRNFAEAKTLTEEIRRLTSEGRHLQEETEQLSQSNEERSEAVKTMMEEAGRLQAELKEEEREAELTIKDGLLAHIGDLSEQLQNVSLSPVVRTLIKAELVSSTSQVKLLCLRHQQPFPADLEDSIEGFLPEETKDLAELTQEESGVGEDPSRHTQAKTSEDLERLEGQLQDAVEKEDYDTAELLQRHIEAIQQQQKQLESVT